MTNNSPSSLLSAKSRENNLHTASWEVPILDETPLACWRTCSMSSFDAECHTSLRQVLTQVSLLREPRWNAARDGDAAAAIGIAIPAIADETFSLPCLDLLMSSVVLCALSGDPAAAVVWAYALRRHRSNSRARTAPPANRSINNSGGARA
jgi:hypothetical protein